MRAACTCGRVVQAHVPRGGDGSAVRMRSHTRPDTGGLCKADRLVDLADTIEEADRG